MKMKRCLALITAFMLIGIAAQAAPNLSDKLQKAAEAAVDYLSSGEYERLVTLLPFSGVAPGAAEWERFARNYDQEALRGRGGSVAFWKGGCWNIAAPVRKAGSDGEVLILLSEDGNTFTGYRYATWSKVEAACRDSEQVVMNGQ